MKYRSLAPKYLYHACDKSLFTFGVSDELEELGTSISQGRALVRR